MVWRLDGRSWVYNRNYPGVNPAENVSLEDPIVAIPLTNHSENSNPPSSPDIRNELAIRFLYQTDVRSVELANIRLANVDFGKHEIRTRSTKPTTGDETAPHVGQSSPTPETKSDGELRLDGLRSERKSVR